MTSYLVDAIEKRMVYTADILEAFVQSDLPEDRPQYICSTGMMVNMILEIDLSYANYVTYIRGKQILYTRLDKAVYGMLLGGILFYKKS